MGRPLGSNLIGRKGNRGNGGYSGVEDGVKERNKRLECEMMM